MKFRLAISAILYVVSWFGLLIAIGLFTPRCHQYYNGTVNVPIECSGSQGGIMGITVNIIGFGLVFGVTGLIAGLYYRFGWPKNNATRHGR